MSRGIFTRIVLLTSVSLAPVVAQDTAERDHQIERLAGLGKLWGDVKFFHPYLAYSLE